MNTNDSQENVSLENALSDVNRFNLKSAVDPFEVELQIDYCHLYHLIIWGQTLSVGWLKG
jgi:hypothetical protein